MCPQNVSWERMKLWWNSLKESDSSNDITYVSIVTDCTNIQDIAMNCDTINTDYAYDIVLYLASI